MLRIGNLLSFYICQEGHPSESSRDMLPHLFPLIKNCSPLNMKTHFGCLKINTKILETLKITSRLKKCLLPLYSYDYLISLVPVWTICFHTQEFSSSTNLLSSFTWCRVHLRKHWGCPRLSCKMGAPKRQRHDSCHFCISNQK